MSAKAEEVKGTGVPSSPSHIPAPAANVVSVEEFAAVDVLYFRIWVMPDSESVALANDIRELSLILSANNHNWTPPQHSRETVKDGISKTLSNISHILSCNAEAPVAVVGSVTPENVDVTVMQSLTSESEFSEPSHGPFIAHSVWRSLRYVGDIIAEDGKTMGVECSVADCLVLLAARREQTRTIGTIVQWLVARGWHALRALLQRSGDHFQNGDLFDLVENWSSTSYDVG